MQDNELTRGKQHLIKKEMSIGSTESFQRVSELDLLRFAAAMMVVFFHYAFRGYAADNLSPVAYPELASLAQYGYLGVQLFFMISGFVILMTASSGDLRKFVISRATRLFPAFWFACTLTFLVILMFGEPQFSATLKQYLINLTMLAEFVDVPLIDGVYWTLTIELKFYAMIALVLALGRINSIEKILMVWLAATLVLDVIPSSRLSGAIIAGQAQFFVAGAVCFLIYHHGASLPRVLTLVACWAIAVYRELAGLHWFLQTYHSQLNPIVVATLISLFFAIMTLVAFRRTGFVGRRNWIAMGALTYPLYLIHQNIGFIIFQRTNGQVNRYLLLLMIIVAMLMLAFFVHAFVEKKLARVLKRLLQSAFDPHRMGSKATT